MSNFLRDPNLPPVETEPAPTADGDGRLPWEQAPEEGYDAATSGGEGPPEPESAEGEGTGEEAEEEPAGEAAAEEEPAAAPAEEPAPTVSGTADTGDDGPAYFLPPDDQIQIGYEVTVQPPPATRSEATERRQAEDGEVLATHTLVDSGSSQLTLSLTDRTIADSPLFLCFEFEKEGATPRVVKAVRVFSLAEPEAKTIEARREVVPGEAHSLKVGTWGALAYDRPDNPTWFEAPEVDPGRVSAEQKGDVTWQLDGEALEGLEGDEVEHTFPEDLAGKKVVLTAKRRDTPHATLELLVGKVSVHGPGRPSGTTRPAPSAIVPLEGDIQFKAYLDPAELTGAEFTWESSSDKVTLTPGANGLVTARGATESEADEDVTLTVKASLNGAEWSATHKVTVKKLPVVKARNGTDDPTGFAPQWHYVYFKAVVPEGMRGRFRWTCSDKLRLMAGSRTDTVTVMARRISDAEEDQWVKVTFTPNGGTAFAPVEHKLTAVSVVFAKDPDQRYGFDNMDNESGKAPRLSVKKNDYTTVKVTLRGPGFDSDDVTFTSDNAGVAEPVAPAAGQTEFMLRVNGKAHNKREVSLRARVDGETGPVCATLSVCVYKQFELRATVYRVHDGASASTAVAAFDLPAAQTLMNKWYQACVVRCTLTDGGLINCAYDANTNGKCELGCSGGVSAEETTVTTAIGAAAGARAVIVKDVNWRFSLNAAVAVGATSLTLDQAGFMNSGNTYTLTGTNAAGNAVSEQVTVQSLTSGAPATLTIQTGLTNDFASGYIDWPLAGRSGNPAWVEESNFVLTTCTIAHELGHAVLNFKDLHQTGLVMNYYIQDDRNLTFRYKSLERHYNAGQFENQWDLVDRS